MLDQLVPVNHGVPDDDFCCASDSLSIIFPSINDMSLTICPNHGFAVPPLTVISSLNYPDQPDLYDPQTWDDPSSSIVSSYCDYSQQPYSTQPALAPKLQDISVLPLQTIYSPPSTFGCFRSPTMRSDYSFPYALPMWYPDVVIKQALPFVFGPEKSASDVLLYDEPVYQRQNSAIPHPVPLISTQPHASYGQPASDQSYSIPFHICPPPPFLCRWLHDDIVCGFTGTLGELRAHYRKSHFAGLPNALVECRWEACEYHKRDDPTIHVMRRECMWRHIREVHLGMKRGA
ncbi:hypothetical protein BDR04DRAFT_1089710 [Suillus decipiens]|nr:hypothetical protein BDR04DRAFT_1089710 [Suillus decipiens]